MEILWELCGHFDWVTEYERYMQGETEKMASASVVDWEANPWDRIKARLKGSLSSHAYQNWVAKTAFESLEQGLLRVAVPDQVTKESMDQDYAKEISAAIRELNLGIETVAYIPRSTVDAGE